MNPNFWNYSSGDNGGRAQVYGWTGPPPANPANRTPIVTGWRPGIAPPPYSTQAAGYTLYPGTNQAQWMSAHHAQASIQSAPAPTSANAGPRGVFPHGHMNYDSYFRTDGLPVIGQHDGNPVHFVEYPANPNYAYGAQYYDGRHIQFNGTYLGISEIQLSTVLSSISIRTLTAWCPMVVQTRDLDSSRSQHTGIGNLEGLGDRRPLWVERGDAANCCYCTAAQHTTSRILLQSDHIGVPTNL
ncbi:uncharacterized protein AB675_8370 [Cyphellophora attinorum]|uniref:Uncharacterized protein n=1 Tax=Cyphellophora attinorum TaxID=1664694 RepID=A0A0N0NR56_9EURO|nr:uncharacterized protein AB675_8370 [Phialophora attinorum]KPI44698.1 hypothetical protein AB675_8370 [Phialophora attinorum]